MSARNDKLVTLKAFFIRTKCLVTTLTSKIGKFAEVKRVLIDHNHEYSNSGDRIESTLGKCNTFLSYFTYDVLLSKCNTPLHISVTVVNHNILFYRISPVNCQRIYNQSS